jgi:hypothetical protein
MIGFYHRWQAEPLPRAVGERFATSLGLGGQRETGLHIATGPVFAATVPGKARGWQPARTARGDVVLFMGHIDNRDELRRLLERPTSADDATLYAAAFSQWKKLCGFPAVRSAAPTFTSGMMMIA